MSGTPLKNKTPNKIVSVLKFGGSCLKDSSSIRKAALIVKEQNERAAVVVSALQGVTDLLLEAYHQALGQEKNFRGILNHLKQKHLILASELLSLKRFGLLSEKLTGIFAGLDRLLKGISLVGETGPGLKARVLSQGERLSAFLVAETLIEIGLEARVYESDRIGLIVDRPGEEATVNIEKFDKNFAGTLKEIERGLFVPVFTGFFGCTENGQIALLGRNGSDYSAAVITRALGADFLITYKDVAGFLTADPDVVPGAKLIPSLSQKEAAELSYFGAKILHPKTFEPISSRRVTLEIRNFDKPQVAGTIITKKAVRTKEIIKSFSVNRNISVLRIEGPNVGYRPGIIGQLGGRLSEKGINILSVLTSQTCINLILNRTEAETAHRLLLKLNEPAIKKIILESDLALIACVGAGLKKRPGIAGRIFSILAREKINLEFFSGGASEVALYLLVKNEDALKAVQALHRDYFRAEGTEKSQKSNRKETYDNVTVLSSA